MLTFKVRLLCPLCQRITEQAVTVLSSDDTSATCQFFCLGKCDYISDAMVCNKTWITAVIIKKPKGGN